MTEAKILEVLDRYARDVSAVGLGMETDERALADMKHIREMIPQMREFLADGRREKLMRWLGFIQGVMAAHRVYSLDELKEHNRGSEGPTFTVLWVVLYEEEAERSYVLGVQTTRREAMSLCETREMTALDWVERSDGSSTTRRRGLTWYRIVPKATITA